jgi:lipopolysaccharide export system protein LptA
MRQGTIRIEADQITIYRIEIEGDKIVAEGSPAHMQQQPEPDSALMHARGGIIEYYRVEERLLLRNDALLEQDGSSVRGDRIDYFIDQQLVKAAADEPGNARRVEVVIPPHKLGE